ncbi:MAG: hypothetical protein PVG35_02380 [Desulfobacterales bacterium]|jgi:hypothetical protein
MSYPYITQEKINVPAIREIEPALSELYLARREGVLREQKLFIGANRRRFRRADKKSAIFETG